MIQGPVCGKFWIFTSIPTFARMIREIIFFIFRSQFISTSDITGFWIYFENIVANGNAIAFWYRDFWLFVFSNSWKSLILVKKNLSNRKYTGSEPLSKWTERLWFENYQVQIKNLEFWVFLWHVLSLAREFPNQKIFSHGSKSSFVLLAAPAAILYSYRAPMNHHRHRHYFSSFFISDTKYSLKWIWTDKSLAWTVLSGVSGRTVDKDCPRVNVSLTDMSDSA